MQIEQLVKQILEQRKSYSLPVAAPCENSDISSAEKDFIVKTGEGFADAYKNILQISNGIKHNGLIIWPIDAQSMDHETILQANLDLRDSLSDDYVYFGQYDEELYVFDKKSKGFCAVEFVGLPIWRKFSNPEEMYIFMLKRALD